MEKATGFKRVINATRYSAQGLVSAWRYEAAFRQECSLAIILIPTAIYLDVESWQRVLMISCLVLVMIVELLNTAIEAAVDRIGDEYHELAGRAKDTGSAAVMISLMLTAYVWGEALWSLWKTSL